MAFQGITAILKLRPTQIREYKMSDLSLVYEYLMRDAFKCKRAEYAFVNADYYRRADKHTYEYPLYVKCALLILLKNGNPHEEELKTAIDQLEECPTIEKADTVLRELNEKKILL